MVPFSHPKNPLTLLTELEKYDGCYYEKGPEACEKEIDVRSIIAEYYYKSMFFLAYIIDTETDCSALLQDRKDVADALLLQAELRERSHYIQEGNIFAYDVKADHDMHERDDFFALIAPALDM